MLPTGNQLSKGLRVEKKRRNRVAAFTGAPMRKGVVYRFLQGHHVNPIRRDEHLQKYV